MREKFWSDVIVLRHHQKQLHVKVMFEGIRVSGHTEEAFRYNTIIG